MISYGVHFLGESQKTTTFLSAGLGSSRNTAKYSGLGRKFQFFFRKVVIMRLGYNQVAKEFHGSYFDGDIVVFGEQEGRACYFVV